MTECINCNKAKKNKENLRRFKPNLFPHRVNKKMGQSPRKKHLRIDYGDGCVIRNSSTKTVISQLWIIISKHAIHH